MPALEQIRVTKKQKKYFESLLTLEDDSMWRVVQRVIDRAELNKTEHELIDMAMNNDVEITED